MATLTASLISTTSRPLPFRARADLVVESQTYQGRSYWVVKDPLALKYYRFEEEEFALLRMIDGQTSLDQLAKQFERRFAPQKISKGELHHLISMLHRSSLLLSTAPGQGRELLKRSQEQASTQRRSALSNVLSIRFKGFDPDRLLDYLARRIGGVFSTYAVAITAIMAAAALLLVFVNFDAFQAKLPTFRGFFAAENWLYLAVILGVTKVCHEFGHGIACKRFGGECHEMGLMLLVLTPCLYCNVSDSWMLPSKWRRAGIAAAGMYVELILAALATFLWWLSEPGMFNSLCLNVMFVCSVSTLLFNANPLMRYDGYYVLADLLEVPNLRQKATSVTHRWLGWACLGLKPAPDPFLPARGRALFALYAVAAAAYRWLVTFGILWFLNQVFEPYGMKIIGQMIACMAIYGLAVHPLWTLYRFLRVPGRTDSVKVLHLLATIAVLGAVTAAVALLPLPHYIRCPVRLRARGAASIYVEAPGRLSAVHVRHGDYVNDDEPLATLQDEDVELALVRLTGRFNQLLRRRENLHREAFDNEQAALQLRETQEELAWLGEQLRQRRQDMQRLSLCATTAGTIIPPAPRTERKDNDGRLRRWTGTPLAPRNEGCLLDKKTLLCQIGDPTKFEAVLAIDQGDMEFVRRGLKVDLFLDPLPGRRLATEIAAISASEMKSSPRSLSQKSGGELLTVTDESGRERPASSTYQAAAPWDDASGALYVGATGHARIHAGQQTLGQRLWRSACRTFHFDL